MIYRGLLANTRPLTRRELLRYSAMAFAFGALPWWTKRASAASAMPIEVLLEPIELTASQTFQPFKRYVLDPDNFDWMADPYGNAVRVTGDNVTMSDFELIGSERWIPRWFDELDNQSHPSTKGLVTGLAGIRNQGFHNMTIERVSVRGFPREAFDGWDLDGSVIRDFYVENCFRGIQTRENSGGTDGFTAERVRVGNTWGPSYGRWTGVGSPPSSTQKSRVQRDGYASGTSLAFGGVSNATITDCAAFGESNGGLKVSGNCTNVTVSKCAVPNLQAADRCSGVTFSKCEINRRYGTRGPAESLIHGLQVTQAPCSVSLVDSSFVNVDALDGDAIQVQNGCVLDARRNTFVQWNGMSGALPAAALHVAMTGTANADFLSTNTFLGQTVKYVQDGAVTTEDCSPPNSIPCVI